MFPGIECTQKEVVWAASACSGTQTTHPNRKLVTDLSQTTPWRMYVNFFIRVVGFNFFD